MYDHLPQWAEMLTLDQYRTFLKEVVRYFDQMHVVASVNEEGGTLTIEGEEGVFGILTLAQLCAQEQDRAQWPKIIRGHFENLAQSKRETTALETKIRDFNAVASLLAVRIYHDEALAGSVAESAMYRRDLEGTITQLVFDLPHSIRGVTREEAAIWGKQNEELFAKGLENVKRISIPEIVPYDLKIKGIPLASRSIFLFCGDVYTTSHVFMLGEHPDCMGKYGSLVGIPHRHSLLVYPINDRATVEVMNRLPRMLAGMFTEGPGSISPRMYWHHDGVFETIPYSFSKDQLYLSPPRELLDQLFP